MYYNIIRIHNFTAASDYLVVVRIFFMIRISIMGPEKSAHAVPQPPKKVFILLPSKYMSAEFAGRYLLIRSYGW